MNATKLWKWAKRYYEKHCREPTMRQATKRFRCTLDDIEAIIDDDVEDVGSYYLGIGVAVQAGGLGGGIGVIETRGDQVVEAY